MSVFSWLTQKLNGVESVVDSSKIKFSSNMSETESVYDKISDLNSDLIRKATVTKTTNGNGDVAGSTSDLIDVSGATILGAYLAKGSYGTHRHVDIGMYGSAGYALRFYDGDTAIASQSVTFDVYYCKL